RSGKFSPGNRAGVGISHAVTIPFGALAKTTANTAAGYRRIDVARSVGIRALDTWNKICERQPEVAEAEAAGMQMFHSAIMDPLYSTARKGKNIVANMFVAKAVLGYRDGGEVQDFGSP